MAEELPQCPGGALGTGPFGAMPLGSGSLFGLAVAGALQLNAVLAQFHGNPQHVNSASLTDALNPSNWTLEAVNPIDATIRIALTVESAILPGFTQPIFQIVYDGPLDSKAIYLLRVSNVLSTEGFEIDGCNTFEFRARFFRDPQVDGRAGQDQGLLRDVANPQLLQDALIEDPPPLGTYQIDDRGDYAQDNNQQGLRKRLFRRAATVTNGFTHLPGYGFKIPPKELGRRSLYRFHSAKIKAQCEREPEVSRASVDIYRIGNPAVLVTRIKAALKTGEVLTVQRSFNVST